MKQIKNMPFSVKERLKNKARLLKRTFNDTLKFYAMERFLYRLSKSDYANTFILKGALIFQVWNRDKFRPTQDIDLLGNTDNSENNIREIIKNILLTEVEDDGLVFFPETIETMLIKEDADYHGVRVVFKGKLDTAKIDMQVDVGFDDIIYPKPEVVKFPVILNFSNPNIMSYTKESVIAEKFEAMVQLGNQNSRMKDFYDIWILSLNFSFDIQNLSEAVKKTFDHRNTKLSADIIAFSKDFPDLKQIQWKAFRNKIKQDDIPESFREIIADIKRIIVPVINTTEQDLQWDHKEKVWELSERSKGNDL
ncbi:MAG: nucleotidyl transferase AbiEii/AbiGii toxin family protein [Candidatus Delongbacteria bacterium]|nr:nucleotidyl transferase AbiEii/AbiGii toxin family protein [Candidatus Delongbacteria bacterium]